MIKLGVYKHWKGNLYLVTEVLQHGDTHEEVVRYIPLYGDRKPSMREVSKFADHIEREGYAGPRFELVHEIVPESNREDEITVNFGTEKFSPVQYENFECGNLLYKSRVRPDETPEMAFDRIWNRLEAFAAKQFEAKHVGFWERHEYAKKPERMLPAQLEASMGFSEEYVSRLKHDAALGYAGMGLVVARDDNGFDVGSWRVWREETQRSIHCNCAEFKEKFQSNSKFRCEHILAVKFFLEGGNKGNPENTSNEAKTIGELVTPKQLVAIRAITNGLNINAETDCFEVMKCKPEALSRKAASAYMDNLKDRKVF